VAAGLAWTPVGGEVLYVEALRMPGKGQLILSGQLGDVMKESARAALSYVQANAAQLGVAEKPLEGWDVHVHVPAGATPKDGPSAGVTLFTALVSLLSGVSGPDRHRDDRRGHPARPRAAGGRHQGEGARSAPLGSSASSFPRRARRSCEKCRSACATS